MVLTTIPRLMVVVLSLQTPPEVSLPMTLIGVAVNAEAPEKSVAIVQCGSAPAVMVRPGERACEVAEIRQVLADAVVIRNLLADRIERLGFGRSGLGMRAAEPAPPAPAVDVPIVRATDTRVDVAVTRGTIDKYLLNLATFLASALATPHFRDGDDGRRVMDGYEIGGIQPGGPVAQLGLKDGDVIESVNGESLGEMSTVIRLASQLPQMTEVTMQVRRNGRLHTFVFTTK